MSAKLFNAVSEYGTIALNVSDEDSEWGKIKSITYTPRNPTGEYWNVGINEKYPVKVAAFNAVTYAYFNLYDLKPGIHLYQEHNTRKADGGLGWVDLMELQNVPDPLHADESLFVPNSQKTTTMMTLGGRNVFVEFPNRKMWHDGRGVYHSRPIPDGEVVFVTYMGDRPWARLVAQGPNRVKVVVESANDDGYYAGDLLHGWLDLIARGGRLMLPATNYKYTTDFKSKQYKMLEGIQKKVAWLYRNLAIDGYDYESHKQSWAADRVVFNTTIRVHEQMLKDVELGSDDPNAAEILAARAEGKVTGRVIMVDGKKVDLGAFKAGTYRVFTKDGRPYSSQPVALAHTNGMDLLSRFYAKGFKLETVLVYEKAK